MRRVDDVGNGFSVGRYPREASARWVAKVFEERTHKQTYFVDVPCSLTARQRAVPLADGSGENTG